MVLGLKQGGDRGVITTGLMELRTTPKQLAAAGLLLLGSPRGFSPRWPHAGKAQNGATDVSRSS
jgi:hypothetical protein